MVASNRGKRFPAEPLTPDEVRALIKACSPRAPTGLRNRALIVVMYRAGLRISEALSLQPKDLDHEQQAIRVLHGKGGRSRVVGLDAGGWAVLQLWLERRKQLGIGNKASVFCTLAGDTIKTPYVRALFPRLAKRAGIERRVHAHALRHSHAWELINEGAGVHVIQAMLGHAALSTTARYIAHLNPTTIIEHARRRSWSL